MLTSSKFTTMKSVKVFSVILMLLSVSSSFGQLTTKLGTGTANVGSLLTQFTNAIKPTSFTSQWATGKTNFLSTASKVTDAVGVGKSIASLAGFIKPDMFKQGFNVQNLISTANTVKTLADASGLLKKFEGGLKPEAFLSSWTSKRTGWLSALSLIK